MIFHYYILNYKVLLSAKRPISMLPGTIQIESSIKCTKYKSRIPFSVKNSKYRKFTGFELSDWLKFEIGPASTTYWDLLAPALEWCSWAACGETVLYYNFLRLTAAILSPQTAILDQICNLLSLLWLTYFIQTYFNTSICPSVVQCPFFHPSQTNLVKSKILWT